MNHMPGRASQFLREVPPSELAETSVGQVFLDIKSHLVDDPDIPGYQKEVRFEHYRSTLVAYHLIKKEDWLHEEVVAKTLKKIRSKIEEAFKPSPVPPEVNQAWKKVEEKVLEMLGEN